MSLLTEKCPICQKKLKNKGQGFFNLKTIKQCPDRHYEKEFHPALETYIETYKVS